MVKPTVVRRMSFAAGPTASVHMPPPIFPYIGARTPFEATTETRFLPFLQPNLVYRDTRAKIEHPDLSSQHPRQRIYLSKRFKTLDRLSDMAKGRLRRLSKHINQSRFLSADYGRVEDLRAILGFDSPAYPSDVTLVAIDTESERHGSKSHIVEVGVTILNTGDIRDLHPGRYAERWMSKAKHHHVVIDITRFPQRRMHSHLFGESLFLSVSATDAAIKRLWNSLGPHVAIIGHSVSADLIALAKCPGLRMNLQEISGTRGTMEKVYDTFEMAKAAQNRGLKFPSFQLGEVTRKLSPVPQFVSGRTMQGCHNAGNDATYSMMAALLFAVRYDPATGRYLGDDRSATPKSWAQQLLTHLVLPCLSKLFRRLDSGLKRQLVTRV